VCSSDAEGIYGEAVIATTDSAFLVAGRRKKVSLVAKVKNRAEGLYEQAKSKYADSESMQKAGKQAGQAASQAGHATGKAASQVADRVKDLASKTSSAVKDARAKGTQDK